MMRPANVMLKYSSVCVCVTDKSSASHTQHKRSVPSFSVDIIICITAENQYEQIHKQENQKVM